MLEKILRFTKEYRMIEKGDRVIAGVSGGADSVCLFLVLQELGKELGFEWKVVHVEHGIRGSESKKDAEFVEDLCKREGIEFQCFHVDVPRTAKEKKCTLEEAARNLRYTILERAAKDWGGAKIAVAHNRQDDAETVLFHLIRGSGLHGICGIFPVRGNIVRPLLHTDREEILAFLEKRNQEYRIDSTNNDERYSRNKIRSKVLPEFCAINSQAIRHIQSTADFVKEVTSYLQEQTKLAESACVNRERGRIRIAREEFFKYDRIIRKEILRSVLYSLMDTGKDIEQVHFEMIEELFFRQTGKRVILPQGIEAWRSYEGIKICASKEIWISSDEHCLKKEELEVSEEKEVRCGPFTMKLVDNREFLGEVPQKTYTKCFDYDKIKDKLLMRKRKEGDYFICDEKGHSQKLKRYFVNEKIEAEEREHIWLLAEGAQYTLYPLYSGGL